MNQKNPLCEVCGENEATHAVFIREPSDTFIGSWKFTCDCTKSIEHNSIPLDKLFGSPTATSEWLEHLRDKTWFNNDDFLAMMERFRSETGNLD